jgi:AcrR family transcriptional regulator
MSQSTTQRILATACQLFAQRGLHAVTMEEVSQAAQVGTGTLYRHVATRDALIRQAIDYAQAELCALLPSAHPGASIHDELRQRWLSAGERALAQPAVFAYWVLVGATPGYRRANATGPRLLAFRGAERVLTWALAREPAWGELLALSLEAQWVVGVQYALHLPAQTGLAPTDLLRQAFTSWWAGVGLDRDAPMPLPTKQV